MQTSSSTATDVPARQAPAVAVLHPDIKARSRRGIYFYAISLIAALKQGGLRTGLVTDLADEALQKGPSAIADAVAWPSDTKVSAVMALPAYLRLALTQGHGARSVPMTADCPLDERNDYLRNVDTFVNLASFYEVCRLAGNKPLMAPPNLDFLTRHGFKLAFTATPMAVQGHRVKVMQTVHDLIILNETVHDLNRAKFERRLRACIDHADLIVAVSKYTRDEILQRYPHAADRVHVAYQPLPVSPASLELSLQAAVQKAVLDKFGLGSANYLFFVGAIEQRKNVATLIRAFRRSRAASHCELVLAGPLDERYAQQEGLMELLSAPAAPQAAHPSIRYIGRVSDVEKLCLLRRARGFAFPSITEGFGIPVIEAQSMGCPVLTSNTSALREVAAQSTILVDRPTDVDELTEAIDHLVFDEALNRRLRSDGLRNAERFHRDQFTNRLGQLTAMLA